MKIYHTETQEDYISLMIELDKQGYTWQTNDKLQDLDLFRHNKQKTIIRAKENKKVTYDCLEDICEKDDVIECKAKGDIMNELELKKQSQDLLVNLASIIGTCTTDLELTDYDLNKTQKLVNKFSETLSEFIDSRKPKFKIGDYVVDTNKNIMTKVSNIAGNGVFGDFIKRLDSGVFKKIIFCCGTSSVRHATDKEIKEYKISLHVYEIRRKSFGPKDTKRDFMSLADAYAEKLLNLTDKYSEEFLNLVDKYTEEAESGLKDE